METIVIHTDGGARGNPGPAGIGVVIQSREGKVLHEIAQYIGEQTNNFAEYEALIQGLEWAVKKFREETRNMSIEVMMDSELVVRQCQGRYKVKEPTLKTQFEHVALLCSNFPNITFTHVRREKNAHADTLVNAAIDAAQKKA